MGKNTNEHSNRYEHDDDDERTLHRDAMAPFATTIHRFAPELASEISGLRDRKRDEPVSWLDGQPEDKTTLSISGLLIYQAYRESTHHLEQEQVQKLADQVKAIIEFPAREELDALQDRVIIADALGEEDTRTLQHEVKTLNMALDMATKEMIQGMDQADPERTANALNFIQHIREQAARQVEGKGPHPPGEEPPEN